MTLTEITASILITALFIAGFSQAFIPAYTRWTMVVSEYQAVNAVRFVAESFKKECQKESRNIEKWKNDIRIVNNMAIHEIKELKQDGVIRALKLSCEISGENFEIIGLATP